MNIKKILSHYLLNLILKINKPRLKYWLLVSFIRLPIFKPTTEFTSICWDYDSQPQYICWEENIHQFKPKNNVWIPIQQPKIQNAMCLIFNGE